MIAGPFGQGLAGRGTLVVQQQKQKICTLQKTVRQRLAISRSVLAHLLLEERLADRLAAPDRDHADRSEQRAAERGEGVEACGARRTQALHLSVELLLLKVGVWLLLRLPAQGAGLDDLLPAALLLRLLHMPLSPLAELHRVLVLIARDVLVAFLELERAHDLLFLDLRARLAVLVRSGHDAAPARALAADAAGPRARAPRAPVAHLAVDALDHRLLLARHRLDFVHRALAPGKAARSVLLNRARAVHRPALVAVRIGLLEGGPRRPLTELALLLRDFVAILARLPSRVAPTRLAQRVVPVGAALLAAVGRVALNDAAAEVAPVALLRAPVAPLRPIAENAIHRIVIRARLRVALLELTVETVHELAVRTLLRLLLLRLGDRRFLLSRSRRRREPALDEGRVRSGRRGGRQRRRQRGRGHRGRRGGRGNGRLRRRDRRRR